MSNKWYNAWAQLESSTLINFTVSIPYSLGQYDLISRSISQYRFFGLRLFDFWDHVFVTAAVKSYGDRKGHQSETTCIVYVFFLKAEVTKVYASFSQGSLVSVNLLLKLLTGSGRLLHVYQRRNIGIHILSRPSEEEALPLILYMDCYTQETAHVTYTDKAKSFTLKRKKLIKTSNVINRLIHSTFKK